MTPPTYSPWWKPLEVLARLGFVRSRPPGSPGHVGAWNIGHDCTRDQVWRSYLNAETLFTQWSPPAVSPWSGYAKPTLFAALPRSKKGLLDVEPARPRRLPSETTLFSKPPLEGGTAVLLDLPGALSVAYAAWFVRRHGMQPVPLFNNWPHDRGVVPAGMTLGALLYYVPWVLEGRRERASGAAPVFLLDRDRLGTRPPGVHDFDNRYFHIDADLPSAATFRRHGIQRLLYIRPQGEVRRPVARPSASPLAEVASRWDSGAHPRFFKTSEEELDDLNTAFHQLGKSLDIQIAGAREDAWEIGDPKPLVPVLRKTPFSTTTDPAFRGFRRASAGGFGRMIPDRQSGGFG